MLMYNRTQIVCKFFTSLCAFLEAKNLGTTAYHAQTPRQMQRLDKTVISTLRQYVKKNQQDREIYVKPQKVVCNAQIPISTSLKTFDIVFFWHPFW